MLSSVLPGVLELPDEVPNFSLSMTWYSGRFALHHVFTRMHLSLARSLCSSSLPFTHLPQGRGPGEKVTAIRYIYENACSCCPKR